MAQKCKKEVSKKSGSSEEIVWVIVQISLQRLLYFCVFSAITMLVGCLACKTTDLSLSKGVLADHYMNNHVIWKKCH